MPTLSELKDKWFLDFDNPPIQFVPVSRHNGSQVSNFSDGNRITMLIDGQAYMEQWANSVTDLTTIGDGEIYHSGWRLEDVTPYGNNSPGLDAISLLIAAHNAGVKVYPLISKHLFSYWTSRDHVLNLRDNGLINAGLDERFPVTGSNHQKFVCFKNPDVNMSKVILGSLDISYTRWDTTEHLPIDLGRHPEGKATHDVGVMVEGPAVSDLEYSFIERFNDSTRGNIEPTDDARPLITSPVSSPNPIGTQSVQVLHTFGTTTPFFGYSWSPEGEYTIWASYINAIDNAEDYIYIEDQYFLSFGYRPWYERPNDYAQNDIIVRLGMAIERGVNVIIVVPSNYEEPFKTQLKNVTEGSTFTSVQEISTSGEGFPTETGIV